jgi:hypothetical protein
MSEQLTVRQLAENVLSPGKIRLFMIQVNCPVKSLTVKEIESLADHIHKEIVNEFERVFYCYEVTE